MCRKKKPRFQGLLRHGLVDDKHQIIYCFVPKAAGSSWKTVLALASGKWNSSRMPHVHNPRVLQSLGIRYFNHLSPADQRQRLDRYFKFLVVRNPLDRLVSAWRNKMVVTGAYGFMAKKILKQHPEMENYNSTGRRRIPAFAQFAEFLMDNQTMDRHWKTIASTCSPCKVKWDAILKTETSDLDSHIVLDKLPEYQKRMLHLNKREDGEVTFQDRVARDLSVYYKDVSLKAGNFLLRLYGSDMTLFGYTWNRTTHVSSCSVPTSHGSTCC